MNVRRFAAAATIVLIAGSAIAQTAEAPKAIPATRIGQPGPAIKSKPANNPNLYDASADAKQLIAAALTKAKKENRRVLVQWGFTNCFWCQLLHREFKSGKLAREIMYEYDVVYIDAANNKANHEVAVGYGANINGYPYLTVLDASGKAIANQETDSLEVKDDKGQSLTGEKAAHDEAKVLAFLTEHQAPHLQADAVVKDGFDKAKASGKKVFLHFGAPWCGYCHMLENWLAQPEVAATFEKDYVDLKVDEDRMVGAQEVEKKFEKPTDSGIPWFVILDPETGKALANSTGPGGNIGCPVSDDEVQHFMGMLEETRKNLTAADLEKLKETLVRNAKKNGH